MSTTIIGLYEDAKPAREAMKALIKAGCKEQDLEFLEAGTDAEGIARDLAGHGFEQEEARRFGKAVADGFILVAAHIADDDADTAAELLDEHGALDLDEAEARIRQKQPSKVRRASNGSPNNGSQTARSEETVKVVEEELEVGKRRVATGGVRVTSTVEERPVHETVRLREEEVDVERHPADQVLSPQEAEAAFQEKTREMAETREEAEVTKRARVVEEVALTRTTREHEEQIEDTVRRTNVKVDRIEGASDRKR
jgi:uncharacterized protein (TIGR02271 family)